MWHHEKRSPQYSERRNNWHTMTSYRSHFHPEKIKWLKQNYQTFQLSVCQCHTLLEKYKYESYAKSNQLKPYFFSGKKFSVRQLQGTYGPFLVKTAHYDIYQENCWNSSKKYKVLFTSGSRWRGPSSIVF